MIYGYCRCSTNETKQDINRQVRELKELGATDKTIYKEYIKTKHIVVYNFNYIDKYFNKLLSEFNDVEIINKKYNNYNIDTIYCYNTLEEEVNGVSVKICDLITSNVDINSIKIYYPSSYQNTINKIFHFNTTIVFMSLTLLTFYAYCIYSIFLSDNSLVIKIFGGILVSLITLLGMSGIDRF